MMQGMQIVDCPGLGQGGQDVHPDVSKRIMEMLSRHTVLMVMTSSRSLHSDTIKVCETTGSSMI